MTIATQPPCQAIECLPPQAQKYYRRFFTASIIVLLTAGASWGAWLLWQIGLAHTFTAISVHAVNAHGQAQIYGWVGLFIMGFGYHVLPRFWRGSLPAPRLAMPVLALMVAGILLRTFGMTAGHLPTAITGNACQLLAIAIFVTQLLLTCRRGKTPFTPSSAFLCAGLLWFLLMSGLDLFHTYATMAAPTREQLLWTIATWQAPLRDLQVHGLALFMILGVSSQMIPAFFSRPQTSPKKSWLAFALLTFAVIAEVAIFLVYRFTDRHAIAALLMFPWLALSAGVAVLVLPWKLWRPARNPNRSDKFLRTAYAWLALSLLMLLFLPAWQALVHVPFSHAWYGAIRHAITVGFVSLMIMGMSARFVPAIRGIPFAGLPTLNAPFLLVNVGCFLRVSLQASTDLLPSSYTILAASALFEIAGLTLWAIDLLKTMWRTRKN